MEGIVALVGLFLLWLLVAPIVALVRAGRAVSEVRNSNAQLWALQERLAAL